MREHSKMPLWQIGNSAFAHPGMLTRCMWPTPHVIEMVAYYEMRCNSIHWKHAVLEIVGIDAFQL